MKKKQIKQEIFLEYLPKHLNGNNKGSIIWEESPDHYIEGVYDDITFSIFIKSYNKDTKKLTIIYDEKEYIMDYSSFRDCKMGGVLGKITSEFKYEIGQAFKDSKRDIVITAERKIKDKKGRIRKYYKYDCNICHFDSGEHYSPKDKKYKNEFWIEESSINNQGCSCCSNHIVVNGINDITTTNPWIIPYIGEEIAKTHTYGSSDKVQVTCPDCGQVKNSIICDIYINHSIGCVCSDKSPYTEKIMFSILKQLNIEFQTQLTQYTFKWCDKYKYDFYFELDNEQYIIETHGIQHYEEMNRKGARTLQEEQENDKLKKELALKNGIKEVNYIVIDCRYSDLEFIKQNILTSKLSELFNLSKIDWFKAEEFTCTNLIKIACEMKKNNSNITTGDIGKIMKYDRHTILDWIKKGCSLGWCTYNANDEMIKIGIKAGKSKAKKVEIFENDISKGIFPSASEIERISEELFGTKLLSSAINRVCHGIKPQYKGYVFKFV